jgi:phosphatidylglycerol:prolipoprotein diacylglycerol transferase
MRPVLFQWRGLTIHSYPALLYLGLVFGMFAGLHAATLEHLDPARVLAATVLLLAVALLGARLLFVVLHWQRFREAPRRILRAREGGAAMYGGLVLAVPVSLPLLGSFRLPFGQFWDAASFTMLVGMIFARGGCFLHGCCAGRATHGRLALHLPDRHGVWARRIPTQILEAAWAAVVLAGAVAAWSHRPFSGALFLYVLGAYGLGRVILESARERQDRVLGFAFHRALSIGFVCAALSAFAIATWSQQESPWPIH